MKRFLCFIILAVMVVSTFSGCAKKKDGSLKIVTTFYPLYALAANVTQGVSGVGISNLTQNAAGCIHDYSLNTKEMRIASDADVLIVNGLGMESFIDEIKSNNPDLILIDSTENLPLLYENNEPNAHIWMSVSGAIGMVDNIAKGLSSIDKGNSERYHKNTLEYDDKLKNLLIEMKTGLSGIKIKNIVTFHEAFDYMAKELGLKVLDTITTVHDNNVSSQRMKSVVDKINQNQPVVLFNEVSNTENYAKTLAQETGCSLFVLDTVTNNADSDVAGDYITTMKQNLAVLKGALSGNEG